jgi:hypothetical protein
VQDLRWERCRIIAGVVVAEVMVAGIDRRATETIRTEVVGGLVQDGDRPVIATVPA